MHLPPISPTTHTNTSNSTVKQKAASKITCHLYNITHIHIPTTCTVHSFAHYIITSCFTPVQYYTRTHPTPVPVHSPPHFSSLSVQHISFLTSTRTCISARSTPHLPVQQTSIEFHFVTLLSFALHHACPCDTVQYSYPFSRACTCMYMDPDSFFSVVSMFYLRTVSRYCPRFSFLLFDSIFTDSDSMFFPITVYLLFLPYLLFANWTITKYTTHTTITYTVHFMRCIWVCQPIPNFSAACHTDFLSKTLTEMCIWFNKTVATQPATWHTSKIHVSTIRCPSAPC